MTKQQYEDMMEFFKEEPDSAIEYLEVNYDELTMEDFQTIYLLISKKVPAETDKEALHRSLIEKLYMLSEEQPKEFKKAMQKLKTLL